MSKGKKSKSAKHFKTSFFDQQAVSYVSAWLSETQRAMPDIKSNDTWPNIDGYIEVTDKEGFPIGKLEVQIKKLPSKNINPPKYSFNDDKFLSYCKDSNNWIPKILIGVRLDDPKEAYWIQIDKSFVDNLGTSKTIHFDKLKVIKNGSKEFIDEWSKIIDLYRYKAEEFEKYKNAYALISETITPALGAIDERYEFIHLFLDELNSLLENEFKLVKRIYYPDAWKIGLTYYEFSQNNLSYALYPISLTKNDVQIKEATKALHEQLRNEGLEFRGFSTQNPILKDHKKYSRDIIREKVLNVLYKKLLNHAGNKDLAKEFIFAFVDKFKIQLGLDKKDKYSLEEVEFAFYNFLPWWTINAYKVLIKKNDIPNRSYLDPDVLSSLNTEELAKVNRLTITTLSKKDKSLPRILVGNEKFPFGIFVELLTYLKNQTGEIKRPYIRKSFERLSKLESNLIWNTLSKEDVANNFHVFQSSLVEAYNQVVLNNFPSLAKELSLPEVIAFSIETKDVYKGFDIPKLHTFYLEGINHTKTTRVVELTEDEKLLLKNSNFNQVELRGNKYKVSTWTEGECDLIYSDTPLFDFLYKLLVEKFTAYFKNHE